jgi:sigma-B regulation protein RsbU (phosphoserine phosphatase)
MSHHLSLNDAPPSPGSEASEQVPRVLIVDDMRIERVLLGRILKREGYEVLEAVSGSEALAKALEHKPDLILLDYDLPGENGVEILGKLKGDGSTAAIPVLFLTGNQAIETKVAAFEAGASDYVVKPYHPEEVKARVRNQLRLSQALRALVRAQAEKLKQISSAQNALLTHPDDLPEANFAVYYESYQEAGGDIYEVIELSPDVHGYFVGDVSGHDIGTGFLTASVKALLKQNCSSLYRPAESMEMINRVLCETLPLGKYLTALYVEVNRARGCATVVSMGHPPAVFAPVLDWTEPLELSGDVLGAFDEVMFSSEQISVQAGDRILLYSDGLIETDGRVWAASVEPLIALVDSLRDLPLAELPSALAKQLVVGKADDDILVLAVEV